MLAATTTVRVSTETREALTRLSAERGISTTDLIADLVMLEQDRVLLAEMDKHFTDLASDPSGSKPYQAEQLLWDATVGDGLT